MNDSSDMISEGSILSGPLFNEPMRVETVRSSGDGTWTVGLEGIHSERFRKVTLNTRNLESLTILDSSVSLLPLVALEVITGGGNDS
jgi:hypothetical protein